MHAYAGCLDDPSRRPACRDHRRLVHGGGAGGGRALSPAATATSARPRSPRGRPRRSGGSFASSPLGPGPGATTSSSRSSSKSARTAGSRDWRQRGDEERVRLLLGAQRRLQRLARRHEGARLVVVGRLDVEEHRARHRARRVAEARRAPLAPSARAVLRLVLRHEAEERAPPPACGGSPSGRRTRRSAPRASSSIRIARSSASLQRERGEVDARGRSSARSSRRWTNRSRMRSRGTAPARRGAAAARAPARRRSAAAPGCGRRRRCSSSVP